MAMMDPNMWNGQDQNMAANDDEFNNFLDMGAMSNMGDGLSFNFADFGASSSASLMHQAHPDSMDTPMTDSYAPSIMAGSGIASHDQPLSMPPSSGHTTMPSPATGNTISDIDAQIQYLQQQKMQQQQGQLEEHQRQLQEQEAVFFAHHQQRNMVPPTPQSLDIQAANQAFGHQVQAPSSGIFDPYPQMKDQQDITFTPLVSPAVTPLDAHFPVDTQFTIPGAYFSPLTSPALHAQNSPMASFDHAQLRRKTDSPVEMDAELSAHSTSSVNGNLAKKARKNNASKTRKSVRQSPITKPQRKKTSSTPLMTAQVISELDKATTERSEVPSMSSSVSAASTGGSENASVSPEPLSEMPPPPLPLPRSARQSPYLPPQNNDVSAPMPLPEFLNGKPSPATPASLFRISPRSKTADANNPGQASSDIMENFQLPEPVHSSKPQRPTVVTQKAVPRVSGKDTNEASTPQLSSPSVIAESSHTTSAIQSPQLTPKSSAMNPNKTPVTAPRGGRKRPSVGSVQVSPALRPRISPSIKPLLPGTPGISAEDSASLLLSSKSNYQRILDGSTIPGVTYPSELSTNLTSKRTSHKIAEQGRRNRINLALQEIGTLLPKNAVRKIEEGEAEAVNGDKKDSKQSNGPNSKASTVEAAIEYIKQLQHEVTEANRRAEDAEKKLAEKVGS
ncbi:helix-loop-helix DNA-binding domain-containing protein [Xylariomycetidae sp. FL2044]|nr:helix-loop-helix DNA-binding domain-containing protein [Xylariomycetidae sp. FL2044]